MTTPHTTYNSQLILRLVILGVALNGLLIIGGTLLEEFLLRGRSRNLDTVIGIPLLSGITLLYLSSLLARRKRAALVISIPVYAFILGLNLMQLLLFSSAHRYAILGIIRNFVFPLLEIGGLLYYCNEFTVKSDIESFRQSLRFIIIVIVVTFCYGVAGYMLMDTHDFHQQIGLGEAAHHTIDQFGLTTNKTLIPYTRRATLFSDSLSVISIGTAAYIAIALFQPIRTRFSDQTHNRERIKTLMLQNSSSSEDYFKLWPYDKLYFFNDTQTAGLALHVYHGVALVVGDPAGNKNYFPTLIRQFQQLCHGNDWRPAFIHIDSGQKQLFEAFDYNLQKIGEEAIINLKHFSQDVENNKYFRHIRSKFIKLGYSTELLQPSHPKELIDRLHFISNSWLKQPGRAERGLMMGYFSKAYLAISAVMVVRDASGNIQAFLNQIPSFDPEEANFDLLRHMANSPGNINDFLLINFIDYIKQQGFLRLNLGLCPLAGLDKKEADQSLIDNALRFAYANGDRLYSFTGLYRFKAKYEPQWSDRYIAYKGGVRAFTRVLNALNQSMKIKQRFNRLLH